MKGIGIRGCPDPFGAKREVQIGLEHIRACLEIAAVTLALVAEVHRDIRRETRRQSARNIAVEHLGLEVAVAKVEVAAEMLSWVARLDQQRAAGRITPKKRALRTF